MAESFTWQSGGCHCGRIRFRCRVPEVLDVYKCNCSICWMRQNHHFVVTLDNFEILCPAPAGEERVNLAGGDAIFPEVPPAARLACEVREELESLCTEYRFNTRVAVHRFCPGCGVSPFYTPRSNPDGLAITIYCMDGYQPQNLALKVNWHDFDGQHWEEQIKTSSITTKTPMGG